MFFLLCTEAVITISRGCLVAKPGCTARGLRTAEVEILTVDQPLVDGIMHAHLVVDVSLEL